MPLGSLHRLVHQGRFAIAFDLRCQFFEIPLAAEVATLFTFIGPDGVIYNFTKLPMGFKFSVSIAQTMMKFLTRKAIEGTRVVTDVYIDNILLVAESMDDLIRAATRFRDLCRHYNVTLGEVSDMAQTVSFRGIQLNFATKSISLSAQLP